MSNTQLKTVPANTKNKLVKGIAFTGVLVLLFQFQPFSHHQTVQARPCQNSCIYVSTPAVPAKPAPPATPEQFTFSRPTAVEAPPAAREEDNADLHLFSFPLMHAHSQASNVEEQPAAVREQYAFLPSLLRAARSLFGAKAHVCE